MPATEKVSGIGGIFLRVRDVAKMSEWYQKNLGIPVTDGGAEFPENTSEKSDNPARTVWALFPFYTDYFGPSNPGFMVNYRVPNLERMLAQLRENGVEIEKVEDYDYGRFAWVTDPEGNRVELWEPKSK
jgi:catechol 2,3-dioxygenase-like lactoylglutathione lyase family enzyme